MDRSPDDMNSYVSKLKQLFGINVVHMYINFAYTRLVVVDIIKFNWIQYFYSFSYKVVSRQHINAIYTWRCPAASFLSCNSAIL